MIILLLEIIFHLSAKVCHQLNPMSQEKVRTHFTTIESLAQEPMRFASKKNSIDILTRQLKRRKEKVRSAQMTMLEILFSFVLSIC